MIGEKQRQILITLGVPLLAGVLFLGLWSNCGNLDKGADGLYNAPIIAPRGPPL